MDDLSRRRLRMQLDKQLEARAIESNLVKAGTLLVAYELLESQVVASTRSFFDLDRADGRAGFQQRYQSEVLALAPNPKHTFLATCRWLCGVGALERADVDLALQVRDYRNTVAHELPRLLVSPGFEVRSDILEAAELLIRKLSQFWASTDLGIVAPNMLADPDVVGVSSGPEMLMRHVRRALTGEDT